MDININISDVPKILLKDECTKVIDYMIKKYDISCQQETIINEVWNNIVSSSETPRRKNNLNLPQEERCLGRKADGQQCTRRRKEGCYCGSHLKKLPCGHINDGQIITPKEKGKRGRKKKNSEIDNRKKYIEAWLDPELGDNFLIDKNNFVYKNDLEYPELVGLKKNGFFQELTELPKNFIEIS